MVALPPIRNYYKKNNIFNNNKMNPQERKPNCHVSKWNGFLGFVIVSAIANILFMIVFDTNEESSPAEKKVAGVIGVLIFIASIISGVAYYRYVDNKTCSVPFGANMSRSN